MKKILYLSAVSMLATSAFGASSSAEINVWRDPVSKMTVSYDDRWAQVSNQNPYDVLTLRGPDDGYGQGIEDRDFAECKVNVKPEGRFQVYPVGLREPIQKVNFGQSYWDQYLARYDDVVLHKGTNSNGLGDGFASMVSTSYTSIIGAKMRKRSLGFASFYNNRVYTVECSAKQSAYHKWHKPFLSFIKSVDFHSHTNHALSGYYRDFITDRTLKVRGPDMFDDTYFGIHKEPKPFFEQIF